MGFDLASKYLIPASGGVRTLVCITYRYYHHFLRLSPISQTRDGRRRLIFTPRFGALGACIGTYFSDRKCAVEKENPGLTIDSNTVSLLAMVEMTTSSNRNSCSRSHVFDRESAVEAENAESVIRDSSQCSQSILEIVETATYQGGVFALDRTFAIKKRCASTWAKTRPHCY